jgi:hypothetical protein
VISPLFHEIERVFPSITGWCSPERAEELAAMIVGLHPERSIVVGVWAGKETIPMAMAHRHIGFGKVLAVDPWAAMASVVGQDGANASWWGDQTKHDYVHAQFMAKIAELGLQDWIEVHRCRSDEFTPTCDFGVAVIDGNHGPQAIEDVKRYAPHVPAGAFMYLDDLKWEGSSVEEAERLAITELGFNRIRYRDTGAFYQRVR